MCSYEGSVEQFHSKAFYLLGNFLAFLPIIELHCGAQTEGQIMIVQSCSSSDSSGYCRK